MFLFLQVLNGISQQGNVQYKMKNGDINWGHLVSSVKPKNSDYVYWVNLGQIDTFISSKKPQLVIEPTIYIKDEPTIYIKDDELEIKNLLESTKNRRNKTIKTPKKFKNWKMKTMMKKRNFKRNHQARM